MINLINCNIDTLAASIVMRYDMTRRVTVSYEWGEIARFIREGQNHGFPSKASRYIIVAGSSWSLFHLIGMF